MPSKTEQVLTYYCGRLANTTVWMVYNGHNHHDRWTIQFRDSTTDEMLCTASFAVNKQRDLLKISFPSLSHTPVQVLGFVTAAGLLEEQIKAARLTCLDAIGLIP